MHTYVRACMCMCMCAIDLDVGGAEINYCSVQPSETTGLSHSSERLMYQGILCLLKMHQVYQGVLEFSGLISLNKIARSGMKRFLR